MTDASVKTFFEVHEKFAEEMQQELAIMIQLEEVLIYKKRAWDKLATNYENATQRATEFEYPGISEGSIRYQMLQDFVLYMNNWRDSTKASMNEVQEQMENIKSLITEKIKVIRAMYEADEEKVEKQ